MTPPLTTFLNSKYPSNYDRSNSEKPFGVVKWHDGVCFYSGSYDRNVHDFADDCITRHLRAVDS